MNQYNQTQKKRKFNLSVGLLKMWYSFRWMLVRVSREFMFESIKIFNIDLFVLIAWCCDICFPMTVQYCGTRVLAIQTTMKLFMLISTVDVPLRKTWVTCICWYIIVIIIIIIIIIFIIIIIIVVVVVVVVLVITFMQSVYNYVPETKHVSRVYSVAAVLYL